MRHLLMGAAVAAVLLSGGCNPPETPEPEVETAQQTPALIIKDVSLTPEQQAELDTLVTNAKSIDQFKDPSAFKDAYGVALAFAKTLYPEPHPKLEDLKLEIAFGEFLLGNTQVALKGLEDSLPVYIAAGDEYQDRRIEINNNLGVAYTQIGKTDMAIPFLESAIAEWRVKYAGELNIDLATALDNLAMAHNRIGNHQIALDTNLEALSMIEGISKSKRRNDQLVISIGNRSKYLAESAQTEQSIANSLALVSRLDDLLGEDHLRGAYVLSSLSATLTQMGQYKSAEYNARRAVEIREENLGKDKVETAVARNVLILSLLEQSKFEEALPLANYNYEVLKKGRGDDAEQTLAANQNRSRALFGVGQVNEALAAQKKSVDFLAQEQTEKSFDRQDTIETYADMLLVSGRYEDASKSIASLRETADLDASMFSYHTLTMTQDLIAANLNPDQSQSPTVRASEDWLDDKLAAEIFNSGNSGARNVSLKNSYGRALAAAFKRQDAEAAFQLMQKYNAGAISKARYKRIMRAQLPRQKDRHMLAKLQSLQEDRTLALQDSYAAAAQGGIAKVGDIQNLLTEIDESIGDLTKALKAKIKSKDILNVRTLQQVQSGLSDDGALMMLSDTPYGLHMFLLTSDDAYLETYDLKSVHKIIGNVSKQLKNPTLLDPDMVHYDDLGGGLFNEAVTLKLGKRKDLAVIARGAIAQIPLSVARLNKEGVRKWAAEEYTFQYLSALADVSDSRQRASSSIEHFIGVGFSQEPSDKVYQTASLDYIYRGGSDAERLKGLPSLPRAGAELRAIRDSLSPKTSTILADKVFTEADVRAQNLKEANVITFATHGLMAGELESYNEAALVISTGSPLSELKNDGLLTTSEISTLNLSAEWVVLSACNSGSGEGETSEALSGLATAFTYAGAKSLLVSHWPVRDDAASFLTVNTVRNTQAGMSKAAALQKAMNDLRNNKNIPNADNPTIWAPFVLIGN